MSDETVATETTEPKNDAANAPKRRRRAEGTAPAGRPRPSTTVVRDAAVLTYLNEQVDESGANVGVTRSKIAEAMGVQPSQAYLSLFRLNNAGYLAKGGAGVNTLWSINTQGAEALEELNKRAAEAQAAKTETSESASSETESTSESDEAIEATEPTE